MYSYRPPVPDGTDLRLHSESTSPPVRDPRRTPRRRGSRRSATPWESDADLVRAILAGSRHHFDLLYGAYFPRVYRFALKRLRDRGEAEDVTQEVFVTVFRALHTYAGSSSLLVWIFGITRNHVNRRFRGRRPRFESLESADADELASAEVPTDRAVDARRVLRSCERLIQSELTPLQRRIFHLKHLRRQSIRAIAESLGKSEDAIKANLYRMRRALADAAPELEQILSA
ncbi:MAG TPA: RNA polymerase sigma factor [Candidatus Limnocylindrales bacterium]|nr:RNA polymerase sigma factor [Candidatus Limnocylindrales bacterium]